MLKGKYRILKWIIGLALILLTFWPWAENQKARSKQMITRTGYGPDMEELPVAVGMENKFSIHEEDGEIYSKDDSIISQDVFVEFEKKRVNITIDDRFQPTEEVAYSFDLRKAKTFANYSGYFRFVFDALQNVELAGEVSNAEGSIRCLEEAKLFELNCFRSEFLINCETLSAVSIQLDSTNLIGTAENVSIQNIQMVNSRVQLNNADLFINNVSIDGECAIELGNASSISNVFGNGSLQLIRDSRFAEPIIQVSNGSLGSQVLDTSFRSKVFIGENVSLSQLRFNPNEVLFMPDSSLSFQQKLQTYTQLVNRYSSVPSELELYEVPLRKLINQHNGNELLDYVQQEWDYYGFKPERRLYVGLKVLLLFFVVNFLLFPGVLSGYTFPPFSGPVQAIHASAGFKRVGLEFLYCMLFSAMIFLLYRLDLDKLKFTRLPLALWIVVQHITGLMFMLFLAHAIFN